MARVICMCGSLGSERWSTETEEDRKAKLAVFSASQSQVLQ